MSSTSRLSSANESLFSTSFSSASSLIALQLFSRIFTFILNQATFRLASPRAYGTAAIQFELLLNTILFISREGVRNSLLRVTKVDTLTKNLSILPVLLGFPLALATSYLYARFAGIEVRNQHYFTTSIGIYAIAALVELISEPLHNLAMLELRTNIRVTAEGFGITSKTIVTFLILLYDARKGAHGTLALLAFAGGQLAYGTAVLLTYLVHYDIQNIWPRRPSQRKDKQSPFFNPELLLLSLTMTSQSLIKHFLTEGDKLILSWFSPLRDQGGYAIATNYGSLVARIVFQPIEEASRIFFSKTLGGESLNTHERLQQAATALSSLLSIQAALSFILLVFGTVYAPIAVQILLPHQYLFTSAPKVLSAWVWYIPVLAFNGGLEAFLSSVATPHDINHQTRWMAIFSLVYILAAITFFRLHLGDASLVYANILNLSVRIVYSGLFIKAFYTQHTAGHFLRWSTILPHWSVLTVGGASALVVRLSENRLNATMATKDGNGISLRSIPTLIHIGIGASMMLASLGVWWMSSGRYLKYPRRSKKE